MALPTEHRSSRTRDDEAILKKSVCFCVVPRINIVIIVVCIQDVLYVFILLIDPLEIFSLLWGQHHYWRASKSTLCTHVAIEQ